MDRHGQNTQAMIVVRAAARPRPTARREPGPLGLSALSVDGRGGQRGLMTYSDYPWAADDLGPASVHLFRLPAGAEGIVVLDNLSLGPAIGGVRLNPTVTVAEVARLARAMTIKSAVAGIPHGGGKSGIRVSHQLSRAEHEAVVRAFAQAIKQLVDYIPGPDMGTDETAMAWIRDEIGRSVGLPAVLGGVPLDQIGATGFGLAECAQALAAAGRFDVTGSRVAVQGFGAVGRHAAVQLAQRGARIVAVSDITGAVHDPDGLDLAALVEFTRTRPVAEYMDAKPLERDDLLTVGCDLLVPAAQADVVHEGNVRDVKAGVVLQGANLPVTAGAEAVLARRGILTVPDVIANAGGVICASVEYRGGGRTQAFAEISERIRANTAEMLERMTRQGVLPREAAMAMARARLHVAETYHRKF
jgi:glutamate dehydrogenase/leucine dehydrogenase